ncbi:MAG: hypothetical protein KGH94_05260 [Candidatus Micrarchaeota archaeon]|nr:hypothetical protein [Candidatus Micrarchaeota archaeon]
MGFLSKFKRQNTQSPEQVIRTTRHTGSVKGELSDREVADVMALARRIEVVVDKLGIHMRNYAQLPED